MSKSILNALLNKFLDVHTILEENQAGFCIACINSNCETTEEEIVGIADKFIDNGNNVRLVIPV